jgi:hypothetical protein
MTNNDNALDSVLGDLDTPAEPACQRFPNEPTPDRARPLDWGSLQAIGLSITACGRAEDACRDLWSVVKRGSPPLPHHP